MVNKTLTDGGVDKIKGTGDYLAYIRQACINMSTLYYHFANSVMNYSEKNAKTHNEIKSIGIRFVNLSRLLRREFHRVYLIGKKSDGDFKDKDIKKLHTKNIEFHTILCSFTGRKKEEVEKLQTKIEELMDSADAIMGEFGGIMDIHVTRYGSTDTDIPGKK